MVINMTPAQRIGELRPLLLKIYVITGWALPVQEIRQILSDQFEKMLVENYPILTPQGIEYAFRKYNKKESYGKEMNLSLIQDVLDQYVSDLTEARSAVESSLNEPQGHIWTDEDYDNDYRAKIQNYLTLLWEGRTNHLWFDFWAEVLVKDGFIKTQESGLDFMHWCLKNNIKKLYERK